MKLSLNTKLSAESLISLYRSIAHTGESCPIVQFTSAYAGEGAFEIAFEMAALAASELGKRVLFLDAGTPHGVAVRLADSARYALNRLPDETDAVAEALVQLEDSSLAYGKLRSEPHAPLHNAHALETLLKALKPRFDCIVIGSENVLGNVFSLSLTRLADGVVLVLEAERMRAPVALQAKELIEAEGAKLIGSVLNRRRLYIPNWLYRRLYRA